MDYNKLIEQLRSTESRSKRELLDAAADAIDGLLTELEEAQNRIAEMEDR